MRVFVIGMVSCALAMLGVRLLRLARQSGAQPERWLGLAFLSAGSCTWLLPLAATGGMPEDLARALALGAQVGLTAAVSFLVVFAWRVFRSDSALARALAIGAIGANGIACAAVLATGMPVPVGSLGLAVIGVRSAALLWLFVESTIYAVRMRRRLRLGLADPIVANRFVLWSVWTGAIAWIPLFVLSLRALGLLEAPVPGQEIPPPVRAAIAALGGGGAVAVTAGWLAFFPPRRYRRWIAARSPAAS